MSDNAYPPVANPGQPIGYPPPVPPTHGPVDLDPDTGRGLGIAGFVLSFIFLLNVVGLILSIVGLVKSRRAGRRNGLALAGIIIASVGVALTVLVIALVVPALLDAAQTCARLGNGVHVIGHSTYTCTPTSFHVSTGF